MTALHDDQRDPQLSALLRANVDAPPLRPGFHDELEARLQSAAAAAVTTVPARRRRVKPLRLLAAASVAAAAAVFAFAVLPALRGGDTATAGDVLAAMTAASGGAQTVRLHVVSTFAVTGMGSDASGEARFADKTDLTLSIAGDSLALVESTSSWKDDEGVWRSTTYSHTTGYDEELHEARSYYTGGSLREGVTIRRPAWKPASTAVGGDAETYPSLSANLRAAVAETDPSLPVEETTYLGRPAWHGVFTVRERWGLDGDADGVPLGRHRGPGDRPPRRRLLHDRGERQAAPVRLGAPRHQPRARPGARPGMAATGRHPVARPTIVDDGTRFGTPEEVAKLSWPTLPLIPQWAPAGYRLTDVASAGTGTGPMSVAAEPRRRGQAREGAAGQHQTVLVRFRRGFGSFVVRDQPQDASARRSTASRTSS